MNFKNWKITKKLSALVMLMSVFMAVIGGVGYYTSSLMTIKAQEMYGDRLLSVKGLNTVRANTNAIEADIVRLILTETNTTQQIELQDDMDRRSKNNDKLLKDYIVRKLDPYEEERITKLKVAVEKYRQEQKVTLELFAVGKRQEGYAYLLQKVDPLRIEVDKYESELAEYNATVAEELNTDIKATASKATVVIAGVTLGAIVLAFIIAAVITLIIVSPLREMLNSISKDASGYITVKRISVTSTDEVGLLATALNDFTDLISGIVKNAANSAQQLVSSSEVLTACADQASQAASQVDASINVVAKSTEDQLIATGEASVVVQQMSSGIQQVSVATNQVAQQAAQAAEKAKAGGKSADRAVCQMVSIEQTVKTSAQVVGKLGERSKEIGQIVDTISSIAGQTNLLALNAAIEAARAGEQGRGFAVVAEEVRKLAEQSEKAAKQIAELISHIQADTDKAVNAMNDGTREVKLGTEVVKTTGTAFQEIVYLISQVSAQVSEISAATQQMASGSQVIVGSVQRIEDLSKKSVAEAQSVSAGTEEQLASIEDIADFSQALAELAQHLQNSVAESAVRMEVEIEIEIEY